MSHLEAFPGGTIISTSPKRITPRLRILLYGFANITS